MSTKNKKRNQRTFLVNNANKTIKNRTDLLRTKRYLLREFLNGISPHDRSQKCGNTPIGEVQMVVGGSKAHFRGLFTCNSVHTCPVCAVKILFHRTKELRQGIKNHLDSGGSVAMLTLTAPHKASDGISKTLNALSAGWSKILNTSTFDKEKSTYGVKCWVKAGEQTIGWNGWHPHAHVLLFLNEELSETDRIKWLKELNKRFIKGLALEGVAVPEGYSLDLVSFENRKGLEITLSSYMCKQGFLGEDIEPLDLLNEPNTGLTPFQLLERAKATGSAEDVSLFIDFQKAMHGKRQLQWSKGARDLLDIEIELTDEEIMELEENSPSHVVIFHPSTLQIVSQNAWVKARLLTAYEEGGLEELEWFLQNFGLVYDVFEIPKAQ